MKDRYAIVGPVYDLISNIYSGKSIQHCKVAHLDQLKPGDKVLFAGVGHGRDALYAAQRGAEVTVVDLSETMLAKFSDVLKKEGATARLVRQVHSDIMTFNETEKYDMVVANFFLNVFQREMMEKVLAHLITLGKPGAQVVVGDFALPTGNIFSRMFKTIYWYLAVVFFWMVAGNAVHNIYDYPQLMRKQGLQIKGKKHFRLLALNCYWSVLGQKPV